MGSAIYSSSDSVGLLIIVLSGLALLYVSSGQDCQHEIRTMDDNEQKATIQDG